MKIHQIPSLTDNYFYVLFDEHSRHCIAVDPPLAEPLLDFLNSYHATLDALWITHHHWDHIGANQELKKKFPHLKIFGFENDAHRIPEITHLLKEKDSILAFELENEFEVLYLPGHTLGHIAFYSPKNKILFCGDTLFAGGCGRLFEGTAEQLYHSLMLKIALLPPDTLLYCAHEYTLSNLAFALTVEPSNENLQNRFKNVKNLRAHQKPSVPTFLSEELLTNPFLRTHSPEIKKNVERLSQKTTSTPLEVFTELRKLKDHS